MKNLISTVLVVVMSILMFQTTGFAYVNEENPYKQSIVLAVNSSDCYINGEKSKIADVVPTIVDGRTLVPARFLSESLGGIAEWNPDTYTATLKCNYRTIDIPIGKDYIVVDGEKNQLDVNSTIMSDRTMLPLRGICEAIGKKVDYYDGLIVIHDGIEENEKSRQQREMMHKTLLGGMTDNDSAYGIKFADTTEISVTEVDVPYYSNELSAISGIYVDGFSILEKDEDYYTLSFNAYNPHYTYGIVEVYNEDGILESYHKINPYVGLGSGITDYVTSVYEIVKGLYYSAKESDLNHFTVKNNAMTQYTKITCTVPRNGSVLVTANQAKSEHLAAYNVIYSLMRLGKAGSSIIPGEDGDIIDDLKESAIDEMIEKLFDSGTAGAELISNFKKASENGIDAFNSKGSITQIMETFLSFCSDNPAEMQLLLDILDVEDVTVNMIESAGTSAVETLVPIISIPLDVWETSDSISVAVCVMIDLDNCYNAGSVKFLFEDSVKYFYEDWSGKNFDTWDDIKYKTNLQWDLINTEYNMDTKIKTVLGTYDGESDDFYVDLNGDDIKEKISFCKEYGKAIKGNGYNQLYVYINGIEAMCIGGGSSENPNILALATCDIDIEDDCGELILVMDSGDGFYSINAIRYSNAGIACMEWSDNNTYRRYFLLEHGMDFETLKLSSYGNGTFLTRYTSHTVSKNKTTSREYKYTYKESSRWGRQMTLQK